MTAVIYTPECYPERQRYVWRFLNGEPIVGAPDHAACPGGHTMPGVLGGWVCPCPCHREDPA